MSDIEITTVQQDRYTLYYVTHPRAYTKDKRLYLGLSSVVYRYGFDIKYEPTNETRITFYEAFFSDDNKSFLPGQIIVNTEDVMKFIIRAAEWYRNEFDMYQTRLEDEWNTTLNRRMKMLEESRDDYDDGPPF